MTVAPVVRAVTVDVNASRAFAIFTERIASWWPLATHSPADALAADLAFVDGELVETAKDGTSSVWGTVTEWAPPSRLAFTWSPGGGPATSICVDFEEQGDRTRVVLTHAGWEVYGDAAGTRRGGYDGGLAWGWVLQLFGLAATDQGEDARPRGTARAGLDVSPLRAAYEDVALAFESGPFASPPPGEWSAPQVLGHVITNAELMCRVIDDVRAGATPRLHGPDDHAPAAIGRCDDLEVAEAATDLRRAGAELVARCAGLSDRDLDAVVQTYIEHRGVPVVDGDMTVGQLLSAEMSLHLPAHAAQLRDLIA